MTDTIAALAGRAVQSPTSMLHDLTLPDDVSTPPSNELDKDAFLQLLVAQLRYQDPLDPSDPADFMATTAQFTTIEKLDELTQQGANNAIVTGLSMASSLVGRSVDYVGPDSSITTGVVTSAQVVNGQVRLITNAGPVDMSTVVGIGRVENTTTPTAGDPANTPQTSETTETTAATVADPATDQQPEQDTHS